MIGAADYHQDRLLPIRTFRSNVSVAAFEFGDGKSGTGKSGTGPFFAGKRGRDPFPFYFFRVKKGPVPFYSRPLYQKGPVPFYSAECAAKSFGLVAVLWQDR